ncbi:MAG: GHKL domain-containing protein [Lachnospiraceae bacterium]|nr:GHKL domain-containing protein [Lachnospiraceae bacterium]MDD5852869.1 GHKL domain-containing protein [Lachnospiraceae bacterium]
MIERVYLLFEIISIILVLWILHGSRKRPGICTIIYVCLELILSSMIAEGWISEIYIIFAYVGIIVVDIFEFNDSLKKAIMYTIIDCLFMFIIQILGVVIFSLIARTEKISIIEVNVISLLLLFVFGIIFIKSKLHLWINKFLEKNFISEFLIGICGIFILIKLKSASMKFYVSWDLVTFSILFLTIVFLITYKLIKEWNMKTKYQEQLEQYDQYNEIYKELISDIRHHQHDYNNHLQALYSMSMTCNSMEELRKEQAEYLDEFDKNHYPYDLIKENVSSVLTAFLYIKFKGIEEKGISVDYKIVVNELERKIPFPDIVKLIGNLLDNATEATLVNDNKRLKFSLIEDDNKVNIRMSNPYDWKSGERFNDFLIDGKSTKGVRRGLGMTNIKEILERYHGSLQVTFDYDEEVKIIQFEIMLPI